MMMRLTRNACALVGLLMATACGGGEEENACDYIAGQEFSSVRPLTCDLASCHWTLEIDSALNYTWTRGAVTTTNTLSCNGLSITAKSATEGSFEGSYDPKSGELVWRGESYVAL